MGSIEEQKVHKKVLESALKGYYGVDLPATWQNEFYNSGVIVASRCHQNLFRPPDKEIEIEYWDQALLNARIIMEGISTYDIGYQFNRMFYVDKIISKHRLYSYVIHYAGMQDFLGVAQKDIAIWDSLSRIPDSFPTSKVIDKQEFLCCDICMP